MEPGKPAEDIAGAIAARRSRLATRAAYGALLLRIAALLAAGYVFFTQLFLIVQVRGMDMFPALKDGDLAIVFRLQREYMQDDVIAYMAEDGLHFGRIVARASDVVTMDDTGILLVNGTAQGGEILYPTYALEGIEYPFRVPENCLFVLGDYRTQATDSRALGPIPLEDVQGKVLTILRRRGL